MKRLLVALCLAVQLGGAAFADTLLEGCKQVEQEAAAPGADLSRVAQAAKSLDAFLSDPSPSYSVAQLDAQKDLLEGARLAVSTDPALHAIEEQVARLRQRLLERENSFQGRDLPTRQELARSRLDLPFQRPYYSDAHQLLDDARTVRSSVDSLWRPRGQSGNSLFGTAPWFGEEANNLTVAATEFEGRCQTSYKNVRDTIPAYRRLARAYQRGDTLAETPYDNNDLRRLREIMDRLAKFYASFKT